MASGIRSRVILIDDELPSLLALEQNLRDEAYKIEKFSSAEEVLAITTNSAPECFIVDVNLPGMSGVDFAHLVHNDPVLRDTPIILVTGKVFSKNLATRAFNNGVFDYLMKPVNIPLLKAKVRNFVRYANYRKALSKVELALAQSEESSANPSDTLNSIKQALEVQL